MVAEIESAEVSPLRSTGVMSSYGVGKFLAEFFTGAFGALVFFYFETELQLRVWMVTLALVIYSLWNAINDPLIGFLTEKPTRLSKKLGRRFPWIIIGALVWVFSFVLIFAVPQGIRGNDGAVFAWLVLTICLYDTLYSVWEVNYQSTFVDKFRSHSSRSKAASIAIVIGVLGIAAGALLPTFLVDYSVFNPATRSLFPAFILDNSVLNIAVIDNTATFITNGWVFSIAGFVLIFTMIPGVRETPKMIDRYMKSVESDEPKEGFFSQLKKAFSHRNYVAFILLFFFYQAATMSLTGSIHYVGKYFLGESSDTTLIFAGMLVGALIAIPLWYYLIKRVKDNQKMITIAALSISVCFIPLIFLRNQIGFIIAMVFWGMSFGGFWLIMTPAMADSIDEIVVKTGKRNDGIFLGFRAFFGRLSYAVQALSFWAIHEITGLDTTEGATQTESALWGINFHTGLVPAILVLIGAIVFWKLNTLNKDKVADIKKQLQNGSVSMLYNVSKASKYLKIATTSIICDEKPEVNLKKMIRFIEDIKEKHPLVELIVFGETIHGWFFNFEKTADYHHQIAETIPGRTTNIMVESAVKNNVYLCFGINEKNEDRFHNSQVLIDPTGEIIAVHRKTKMRETFFSPGENLVTVTQIKGIKTGIVICYDVQSKEVNKALRRNKLDLIIHSLADDENPREFGSGYLARSYDAWLVNANRFGEEGGHYWNGWLTITNPVGKTCLKGKEREQYLYYEIGIVEQGLFVRTLRKLFVRTSRIFLVLKNLDLALSTVFDRFKVKSKKK